MRGIQDLPPELIAQVVSYLPTAQATANFSQTSQHFKRDVDDAAWQSFVSSRFPSIQVRGDSINRDWKSVAHSLTALSQNLDRKAFLARYLEPKKYIQLPNFQLGNRWKLGRGQSMGYRPIIDSYEELCGDRIWQRRDVLAWGAGSQLAVRVRNLDWKHGIWEDRPFGVRDSFGHLSNWYLWKPPNAREGVDDVTSMKLLPDHFKFSKTDNRVNLVYCTHQGQLSLASLPRFTTPSGNNIPAQQFATNGVPIKEIACSSPRSRLLAAAYGPSEDVNRVSLYTIPGSWPTGPIEETDSVLVRTEENYAIIWSTEFLSDKRFAVGVGPSVQQVHIYDVGPSGIMESRKLSWTEGLGPSIGDPGRYRKSAAYCIKPLPESSCAGNRPDDLFLTGGYDGIIRLHDLRVSQPTVSEYSVPTNESAIYDMALIGRERIVAGCAQHGALTIFDIRVPGGRNYSYQSAIDESLGAETNANLIWLNPCSSQKDTFNSRERWMSDWRLGKSPVYSVSSPSPYSPFIYAGVEGNVMELAFTSYTDGTPDPIFRPLRSTSNADFIAQEKEILNLPMNDEENGRLRLLKQKRLANTKCGEGIAGYDERWEI